MCSKDSVDPLGGGGRSPWGRCRGGDIIGGDFQGESVGAEMPRGRCQGETPQGETSCYHSPFGDVRHEVRSVRQFCDDVVVTVRLHHLQELDDVGVLQTLQHRRLPVEVPPGVLPPHHHPLVHHLHRHLPEQTNITGSTPGQKVGGISTERHTVWYNLQPVAYRGGGGRGGHGPRAQSLEGAPAQLVGANFNGANG